MADLLPLVVLGPVLLGSVLALLPETAARRVGVAGGVAWTALVLAVVDTVARSGTLEVTLGQWQRPVGIELRADGLAAVLLLVSAVVSLAVAVAASSAQAPDVAGSRWFWPLWSMLNGALASAYLAADLFNTYVALELVTVVGVGMIALSGPEALRPALRYLLVAVLGSLAFLVAVAVLYAGSGTLATADVAPVGAAEPTVLVALVLASVGLAVKTALWPMHGWLPPAHAAASSAVSPLMSALVVKASLVVLLRLWTDVANGRAPVAAAQVLGVLGAAAIVHGSLAAARQTSLKRVVACSTVAQVGYFMVALPLVTSSGAAGVAAWQGLLLLVAAHALAKAAMFLSAGALVRAHGSTDLAVMRSAATRAPMEVLTFGAAGVVLAGLPPGLAFAGKWQLLTAGIETGQWWWVAVLLVGGLLTMVYVVRALREMLLAPDHDADELADRARPFEVPLDRGPRRLRWSALGLVVVAIVAGLAPMGLLDLAVVGLPPGVGR